jgi:glycosyltransferase involved in cell wall biosynthesis
VIVPAYNEAAVIKRTLAPLSRAAVDGFIELVVVCNGCTDDTAYVARNVPGVRVVELDHGSKPAALNAGDDAATLWPRLYLDADIQISAAAVLAILDRLAQGDVLVARPDSRYDSGGASALARSYYRARRRIPQHNGDVGYRGVRTQREGSPGFGAFPTVPGDDLYFDTRFDAHEKAVVATDPSVGENARRRQEPACDLAAWPSGRSRTGRARVHQRGHCSRGRTYHPRSSIGGRCGGVPRHSANRTVAFPQRACICMGARQEQAREQVSAAARRRHSLRCG